MRLTASGAIRRSATVEQALSVVVRDAYEVLLGDGAPGSRLREPAVHAAVHRLFTRRQPTLVRHDRVRKHRQVGAFRAPDDAGEADCVYWCGACPHRSQPGGDSTGTRLGHRDIRRYGPAAHRRKYTSYVWLWSVGSDPYGGPEGHEVTIVAQLRVPPLDGLSGRVHGGGRGHTGAHVLDVRDETVGRRQDGGACGEGDVASVRRHGDTRDAAPRDTPLGVRRHRYGHTPQAVAAKHRLPVSCRPIRGAALDMATKRPFADTAPLLQPVNWPPPGLRTPAHFPAAAHDERRYQSAH